MGEVSLSRAKRAYDPFLWFQRGLLILAFLTVLSTAVYWLLGRYYGQPDWSLLRCLFMVVITLSTIGYGDWLEIRDKPLAELYTMFLAVVGVGVPAFVITNVIAIVVEGVMGDAWQRRRMDKRIAGLREHIIVCGVGVTGLHILEELVKTGRPFVCIDRNQEHLHRAVEQLGEFPFLVGPADEDEVLKKGGIERASGLIACLTDDKDNLYITLTARKLNPALRIVSKVIEANAGPKLLAAGANAVVNPTAIGGLRLVSEMVRPTVVTFLDSMIRDPQDNFRFEELSVGRGSAVDGKCLGEANLRKSADVLVVAVRSPASGKFQYNPKAECLLEAGCTIVLLGRQQDLQALHPAFAAPVGGLSKTG